MDMRAQTTFDFLIGIVVFLVVVAFVFLFVPGILEPFSATGGEDPVVSDRIADTLTSDMLGSAEQPRVLDRYCTVAFFAGNNPSDCDFGGETLEERFHLDSSQNVNVTLRGNLTGDGTEVPCWDDTDHEWAETDANCSTPLQIGDSRPAPETETITAQRAVSFGEHGLTLEVVVW
jgi:hypothetical protein